MRNQSGYRDPTAGMAIHNAMHPKKEDLQRQREEYEKAKQIRHQRYCWKPPEEKTK